jgi:alkanesulfonate monooxygenase SsuD/methylene tetrahydromethanopterin reductase-like flavin-dependent oxidoreductase (luciferase family)
MSDNIIFGVSGGWEGWTFEDAKNFFIEAENLGFDLFTVMDHLMNQFVPEGEGPLECWTTLAGLAAVTDKIKLAPLVACYGYHRPTMMAKMATTIDRISNGRLIFGIGAGWHEVEFKGFTGRFPSVRERMRGLEESLEICKSMFSNEWTTYHGRLYEVENVQNKPLPVQKHIPIMVGGSGEKRTLRIAAKHADISHFISKGSIEEDLRVFGVLDKHCETVGRDKTEIIKALTLPTFLGSSEPDVRSKWERFCAERGWPPWTVNFWMKRNPVQGFLPEHCINVLNNYIEEGVTLFTFCFLDIDDMRTFSDEVIPEIL